MLIFIIQFIVVCFDNLCKNKYYMNKLQNNFKLVKRNWNQNLYYCHCFHNIKCIIRKHLSLVLVLFVVVVSYCVLNKTSCFVYQINIQMKYQISQNNILPEQIISVIDLTRMFFLIQVLQLFGCIFFGYKMIFCWYWDCWKI